VVTSSEPLTPTQEFDLRASREGWTIPSSTSAASYVNAICAEFDAPEELLISHGERMQVEWTSFPALFEACVPLLCPQHQLLLNAAKNGTVVPSVRDGVYFVPDEIKPGKYATVDRVTDCYWERTSSNGTILDNNFASAAKQISVTIKPSDGSFKSQNCGPWKKVG
jgi:hypothetical protein